MTTVYVTQPGREVNLFEADARVDQPDDAVYPYDAVYAPDETDEHERRRSGGRRWCPRRTPRSRRR